MNALQSVGVAVSAQHARTRVASGAWKTPSLPWNHFFCFAGTNQGMSHWKSFLTPQLTEGPLDQVSVTATLHLARGNKPPTQKKKPDLELTVRSLSSQAGAQQAEEPQEQHHRKVQGDFHLTMKWVHTQSVAVVPFSGTSVGFRIDQLTNSHSRQASPFGLVGSGLNC